MPQYDAADRTQNHLISDTGWPGLGVPCGWQTDPRLNEVGGGDRSYSWSAGM